MHAWVLTAKRLFLQIAIGNIRISLRETLLFEEINTRIIIPSVVVPILVILLCAGIGIVGICMVLRRNYKANVINLTAEMSNLKG